MRLFSAGLVLAAAPLVTGCLAFARGQAGAAMSASDTPGHSGPVVGADGVFTLPKLKWLDGESAFPFGFHTSFEAVLAPERKDFAWGTGLAYFGTPRPVSGPRPRRPGRRPPRGAAGPEEAAWSTRDSHSGGRSRR